MDFPRIARGRIAPRRVVAGGVVGAHPDHLHVRLPGFPRQTAEQQSAEWRHLASDGRHPGVVVVVFLGRVVEVEVEVVEVMVDVVVVLDVVVVTAHEACSTMSWDVLFALTPTAHKSEPSAVPSMSSSKLVLGKAGLGTMVHAVPSQCSMS
jgi:hypothetical protein